MAVSFQSTMFGTASTRRPTARSLSAIKARGVGFVVRDFEVPAGECVTHIGVDTKLSNNTKL
jgi:hypothetical protein